MHATHLYSTSDLQLIPLLGQQSRINLNKTRPFSARRLGADTSRCFVPLAAISTLLDSIPKVSSIAVVVRDGKQLILQLQKTNQECSESFRFWLSGARHSLNRRWNLSSVDFLSSLSIYHAAPPMCWQLGRCRASSPIVDREHA